jgi:hypothetical protein
LKKQGRHNKISFTQYEEVRDKFRVLLENSKLGEITLTSKQKAGYEKFADIVDELTSGKRSVQWLRSAEIEVTKDSQARSVSEDPKHLSKTIDITKKKKKVLAPLLVRSTKSSHVLADGFHRLKAVRKLIERDVLEQSFVMPCVVLSREEDRQLTETMASIQGGMNEPPVQHVQKGNTPNDLQNVIRQDAELNDIDLQDEKQFENMRKRLVLEYPAHEDRIVRAMNRQKNITARNALGVITDTSANFEKEFLTTFCSNDKNGKKRMVGDKSLKTYTFVVSGNVFRHAYVHRISNRGSELNSAKTSLAIIRDDSPKLPIVELFSDQANKGDKETVVKARMTYFKNEYKLYKIFGDKMVTSDAVVFAPQIDGGAEIRLSEDLVMNVQTEGNVHLAKNWRLVTRRERLDHYVTNPSEAYKPEWLSPHPVSLQQKVMPRKVDKQMNMVELWQAFEHNDENGFELDGTESN